MAKSVTFDNLKQGTDYTVRVMSYKQLPNGEKIFQTCIKDMVKTVHTIPGKLITTLTAGAKIRDGGRTFTILDFNHANYPVNSVQLLDNVPFTSSFGTAGTNVDSFLPQYSQNLQNAFLTCDYPTGSVTGTTGEDSVVTYSFNKVNAPSKLSIPSLYEIGLTYTWGGTLPDNMIDGTSFVYFQNSANRILAEGEWGLRSYIYSLDGTTWTLPKIDTAGSLVQHQLASGETVQLNIRCIASVSNTLRVSTSPDSSGVYDIVWI